MARKTRFFEPNIPCHITHRGNNKMPIFCKNEDYLFFLSLLKEAKERHPCKLYSYCLMNNHIHLLIEPEIKENVSCFIKLIAAKYACHFNKTNSRTGTLWEGRFKCSLVKSERYFVSCLHYIESNPVRARISDSAGSYPWSSFKIRGYGHINGIIDLDYWYESLGKTQQEKQLVYRKMFELDKSDDFKLIRKMTGKNGVME